MIRLLLISLIYIYYYNNNNNKKINFIIWKGYNKSNKDYLNFSKNLNNIAHINNLKLKVDIKHQYNLDNISISKNTILFGHSSGGYECLKYKNDKLLAKIVYGATHNSYNKLKYIEKIEKDNIPTLIMIGDKDGILSNDFLLDEIKYNKIYNKTNQTIVCVNNTNHLCICNNKVGILSKLLGISDNNLDVDNNLMLNTVSNIIVNYIKNLSSII